MPRQQGRGWDRVEAEREGAGGKAGGQAGAAGASIIGPARNASSPQKEILRLRKDNKGPRFISNAEPAPRRPASAASPQRTPLSVQEPGGQALGPEADGWGPGGRGTSHGELGGDTQGQKRTGGG